MSSRTPRKSSAKSVNSESSISASPYRQPGWTVAKLREELGRYDLPKSGKKEELIQRLEEVVSSTSNDSSFSPSTSAKAKKIVVQYEEEKQEQEIIEEIEFEAEETDGEEESRRRSSRRSLSRSSKVSHYTDKSSKSPAPSTRAKSQSPSKRSPSKSPAPSFRSATSVKSRKSVRGVSSERVQDIEELSLLRSPLKTFGYFFMEANELIMKAISYALSRRVLLSAFVALVVVFYSARTMKSPYQKSVKQFEDFALWYLYWVILGIASSIGLGTGLHTFVLFLGPFIAKVTVKAYECGGTDFGTIGASSKNFICKNPLEDVNLPLAAIYAKVMFESFAWGAGTAIGELPPYFVARAAAIAGQEDEEFDHIQELQRKPKSKLSLWEKVQLFMFSMMERMGFFGILLSASIPNPLFDLAGITCGHFMVPFATFFGATFIGKAVIKAAIQTWFIIVLFSRENIDYILSKLKNTQFHKYAMNFFDSQKQKFTSKVADSPASALSNVWNGIITLMIAYFLLSIVTSMANSRLKRFRDNK